MRRHICLILAIILALTAISLILNGASAAEGYVTLHFDTYGIGAPVESITVPKGTTIGEAMQMESWPHPADKDWIFVDWYLDSEINFRIDKKDVIDEEFTLFAFWLRKGEKLEATKLEGGIEYGKGVNLSWYLRTGPQKYVIHRKNGSKDVEIGTTTGLTYTDTGVRCGEQFTYYVVGVNEDPYLESYPSNELTVLYNPFSDIDTSKSYFKHIAWAYNNNVIKGTTDTTFEPNRECRRCDLAVMLYRMYGKPSISGMNNPFSDVKSSDYFYSAVVWASNKGYIKGLSGTNKFNPKGSITRQDMVVILWRIAGCPVVSVSNPFKDVKKGHYAYNAIMWAYKNKITSGTSATTFAPTANCQRYQLAVFLHKFNDIEHVIS